MTDDEASIIAPKYLLRYPTSFPMLVDDGGRALAVTWPRPEGLPFMLLVDRRGRLVRTFLGHTSLEELERAVIPLLSPNS